MKEKVLFLCLLFSCVFSFNLYEDIIREKKFNLRFRSKGKISADPWDIYDFYVFSTQWAMTYCEGKDNSCKSKLAPIPKHHLTLHGLWPSLTTGKQIPVCNKGTIPIIDDGSETFLEMRKFWPSLDEDNKSFWEHEYNKHGYCYMKHIGADVNQPTIYFAKALELLKSLKINTLIIDTFGDKDGPINFNFGEFRKKLEEKLGGAYFVATCKGVNGKKYLNEIRFKLDMDLKLTEKGNINGACSDKSEIYVDYW